nr:chemotaxis protein CheB [Oculatella sp. LEGE 06141]
MVPSSFDIVAIATSAGGLQALSQLLANLPATFPVPVVVVQHLEPSRRSLLDVILDRVTGLLVKQAENGEQLQPGTVYIAPSNYHLLVNLDRTLTLDQTVAVNFVRPSADILFRSVASSYGKRAIAVVLTGTGSDGAEGIRAIKANQGIVIAQDETAEFFGMPNAAIRTQNVDFVLSLIQIASALTQLVNQGHWNQGAE